MVGLIALCAVSHVDDAHLERLPSFAERLRWFTTNKSEYTSTVVETDEGDTLFAILAPTQLRRLLERTLDETEFLSPHGIRSVSAYHRDHPFTIALDGQIFRVDYEPGESTTALFGGNSNWRGPVWMPLNALIIESLRRFDRHLGGRFTVSLPTGSSGEVSLADAADDLSRRLVALFLPDDAGQVPAAGSRAWPPGLLLFHEYFHGDTGAGLGASHQTGWTALAAHLVLTTSKK